MHPVIVQWGPFTLRSYGLMVALGVVVGIAWTRRVFRQQGLPLDALYDAAVAAVALGVLGARLLYVALHWSVYRTQLSTIPMVWADGGLSFHGAVLGGVVGVWWVTRRYRLPFGRVADAAAPGLALGHALGRVGCFLNGCCYGAPTTLPIGVRFHNPTLGVDTLPSHPAQLYEAVGLLVLFAVLARSARTAPYQGAVFVNWLMGYSVLRFLVEFARAGATATVVNGLTQAQWVSVALFCGALAYHRWRQRA